MISDLLKIKIDQAFKAIDEAKLVAFSDKGINPKNKEAVEAFIALDKCLDLLEDL